MNVKRFEDLDCWKVARELCQDIFKLTSENFKRDYKHIDQINGSSGSCMDNIAEGFGRRGNKEFCYFLHVSLASSYEVKSQLYRALDKGYLSKEEFELTIRKADKTAAIVFSLIRSIENSGFKGHKFK